MSASYICLHDDIISVSSRQAAPMSRRRAGAPMRSERRRNAGRGSRYDSVVHAERARIRESRRRGEASPSGSASGGGSGRDRPHGLRPPLALGADHCLEPSLELVGHTVRGLFPRSFYGCTEVSGHERTGPASALSYAPGAHPGPKLLVSFDRLKLLPPGFRARSDFMERRHSWPSIRPRRTVTPAPEHPWPSARTGRTSALPVPAARSRRPTAPARTRARRPRCRWRCPGAE